MTIDDQTIGDFAVSRLSQILPMCRENRQSSQTSGKCQKNRNAPNFPDLSPTVPDDRRCLRLSAKFGTVGKQRNPRSSGIFLTLKTRLNRKYVRAMHQLLILLKICIILAFRYICVCNLKPNFCLLQVSEAIF